jgi:hypothetical protein
MKRRQFPDDPWFYASYEGARIAALLKTCDLPFLEKLEFIDDAFRLFSKPAAGAQGADSAPRVAETET